jgi:hypothetical protein
LSRPARLPLAPIAAAILILILLAIVALLVL